MPEIKTELVDDFSNQIERIGRDTLIKLSEQINKELNSRRFIRDKQEAANHLKLAYEALIRGAFKNANEYATKAMSFLNIVERQLYETPLKKGVLDAN